ncbi:MAG: Gfo/Idh/MocA family oxidoreductase [Terriglobia bacterium]
MSTRRAFMQKALSGSAALAAYGLFPSSRVLGANDRIRIGLIGAGGRGTQIFKAALKCPNVEGVAAADVYTRRLDELKASIPAIQTYRDFRNLLDDKSIDAVLIATPQHLHALNFIPAIQAGKDVYQEKTMAFNPDHAKRMRKALEGSGRVVQVGIQFTSSPAVEQVREYLKPEHIGMITQLHTFHYRNAPYGGWKRPVPADCDLQHVDWKAFEGEAKEHPFDPNRLINWRFFWDYSGGNVFENMTHQVGFWYKLLDLKIPQKATMVGANYISPDMQVPDTMDVAMIQREKILFTWNSMFGNNLMGAGYDEVLGNKGTILRDENFNVRFVPQEKKAVAPGLGEAPGKAPDIVGMSDISVLHMQNFFDCVRSRKEPNCPFELGFRSAVACRMAVESYRQGRTVSWDEQKEEIV